MPLYDIFKYKEDQLIERAIALASISHIDQIDKVGYPYIYHPMRVMLHVTSRDEKVVAILHDTVEDTELTLLDLKYLGYPKRLIDAVDAISKRDNETNDDYMNRCVVNPIARAVKIADLFDNMSPIRQAGLSPEDQLRLKEKYKKHLQIALSYDDS